MSHRSPVSPRLPGAWLSLARKSIACCLVAWVCMGLALAASPAPATGEEQARAPLTIELLDQDMRAHISVDGTGVVLPGDGRETRFRLDFTLPAHEQGASPWQLRFNRVELDRLQLSAPDWQPVAQRFFFPSPQDGLLPMAFQQDLPAQWTGPISVEVRVDTELTRTLRPQVVRTSLGSEQDKQQLAIAVALYASMLVLAVVALSLLLGARELSFLSLLGFASASLLQMLVVNGHAYVIPALAWLQPVGAQGVHVTMLLVCATGVAVARDYAGKRPANPWLRWLPLAGVWAITALAVACLLGFNPGPQAMQTLVTCTWVVAALLALLAFASATLRRTWLGWPLLAALLLLGISGTLYELSVRGMGRPFWGSFGYQVGLVLVALVLVVALIGRIADFRLKHEHERTARKVSEQRLEQQEVYAALAQQMRLRLADVAPKDMAWYAVQMAMEKLLPLLQLNSATILLYRAGYDQMRISEPVTHTSRLAALTDANSATLRAVAQRQVAMGDLQLTPASTDVTAARMPAVVYAAVPLSLVGGGIGIALLERFSVHAFNNEEIALATQFGQLVVDQTAEARAKDTLRRSAELDTLTGTLNRNAIDNALTRAFAEANRKHQSLSILFVDMDRFKLVNDTYGHACGDHCLKQLAVTLRDTLQPTDLLGRYGGEEFLVILPGASDGAHDIGERLRQRVEQARVEWQGHVIRLTVSVGVATRQADEQSVMAVLERADQALYAAKREGRNRVSVAPSLP